MFYLYAAKYNVSGFFVDFPICYIAGKINRINFFLLFAFYCFHFLNTKALQHYEDQGLKNVARIVEHFFMLLMAFNEYFHLCMSLHA